MTLHVSILGIDGSGKSTLTAALPPILAAELGVLAGAAGEEYLLAGPDEDCLATKFEPDGLPLSCRLALRLKRKAKQLVNYRKIYPLIKLPQMIAQDHAARLLARRYGPAVIVSDGNTLLSGAGRAGNYVRAASDPRMAGRPAPGAQDLAAAFHYILEGTPVPSENQSRLPPLNKGRQLSQLCHIMGWEGIWLPDLVVLIDVSPEVALSRIVKRSKMDLHENLADLTQAREMYLKTLDTVRHYRASNTVHCIAADHLSPGEIIHSIVESVRQLLLTRAAPPPTPARPLGTSGEKLSDGALWKKVVSYRYLMHYLLPKWFQGAWREPTFAISKLGKLCLKEGYSAGVMRAIYDQDEKPHGLLDRIFLAYPMHRAVYDRLQILTRNLEPILKEKLERQPQVSIFTAPSGFAYDLFCPLQALARQQPTLMRKVRLLAADLDPYNCLGHELTEKAQPLGIQFQFMRGDLTQPEMQQQFSQAAPFDLVLFVGLSSWLPKPFLLRHLVWLRQHLCNDGCLVTDSFTPEAYALSGHYAGYKAHYYTPEQYKVLLDYCGFDGVNAHIESGRDGINHVCLAAPRQSGKTPSSTCVNANANRRETEFVITDRL